MPAGYLLVSIEKKRMYAHRIAFYLHHGRWPDGDIDHINGVRNDNRISNLREASPSQNAANMFVIKGRTPYKGVYRHKEGKYMAQLRHNYKYYYLGYHDTPEEAHAAYMKKASELFGRFANQGETEDAQ